MQRRLAQVNADSRSFGPLVVRSLGLEGIVEHVHRTTERLKVFRVGSNVAGTEELDRGLPIFVL